MALQTRYVDKATAAPGGTGAIGDKFKFLYEATSDIAADGGANHFKVWVKAFSDAYGILAAEADDADHDGAAGATPIYLDQSSPAVTTPNVFEGYHTDPGDGGIVIVDCNAQGFDYGLDFSPVGLSTYVIFRNFNFVNAASVGIYGNTSDKSHFINCRVYNSGSHGIQVDNACNFVNCLIDNNGGNGADVTNTCNFIACIIRNNTAHGISSDNQVCVYCTAYGNGDIDFDTNATSTCTWIGNTVDGNAKDHIGIFNTNAIAYQAIAINNIITDCTIGLDHDSGPSEMLIEMNNLFFDNTTNIGDWTDTDASPAAGVAGTGVGDRADVHGDPDFDGAADMNIGVDSLARKKAIDSRFAKAFWDSYNAGAGANPPTP
ncbi:MAG: right-handed parallel beta-helix repeat-containing protein [FCB group bacterium]|nr:right-handed parallel beta-helix repeat-containing protein [FCB group bacterium]